MGIEEKYQKLEKSINIKKKEKQNFNQLCEEFIQQKQAPFLIIHLVEQTPYNFIKTNKKLVLFFADN